MRAATGGPTPNPEPGALSPDATRYGAGPYASSGMRQGGETSGSPIDCEVAPERLVDRERVHGEPLQNLLRLPVVHLCGPWPALSTRGVDHFVTFKGGKSEAATRAKLGL